MEGRIYLDHAASSPTLPEVADAMVPWLRDAGNASSLHAEGRRARHALDESREILAEAFGCSFGEALFTSSGTEAANMALVGVALAGRGGSRNRILIGASEHHCVLHTRRMLESLGYVVDLVPVDRNARVRVEALESAIGSDALLVSAMHANNELGTLQPACEISAIAHRHGALYHCDAVQSFLDPQFDMYKINPDLVSISAHKLGGPMGVGALYVRAGTKIAPLIAGGGQEREMRAGTENVAAAVGFAEAIRQVSKTPDARCVARDRFLSCLNVSGFVETVADRNAVLSSHAHIRTPGIQAETMLIVLDRMGVSASSGAACSSGSLEPSHVLLACGYSPTEAREGLRFTFARRTAIATAEEGAKRVNLAAVQIRNSGGV